MNKYEEQQKAILGRMATAVTGMGINVTRKSPTIIMDDIEDSWLSDKFFNPNQDPILTPREEMIMQGDFDDNFDGWVILPRDPLDMETNGWELDHKKDSIVGIRVPKEGTYKISYGMVQEGKSYTIDSISVKEVIEATKNGIDRMPKKKDVPHWQRMNRKGKRF